MGKGLTYLRRVGLSIRRDLEAAVLAKGGVIGIAAASRITTVVTALVQAHRVARILATAGEPGAAGILDHATWLAYSDRLIKYREAADRGIAALGLDAEAKPKDIWDQIYNAPPSSPALAGASAAAPGGQTDPETPNAAESKPEALAGKPEGATDA